MTKPQRYGYRLVATPYGTCDDELLPDPSGDWCRWEDVAGLVRVAEQAGEYLNLVGFSEADMCPDGPCDEQPCGLLHALHALRKNSTDRRKR